MGEADFNQFLRLRKQLVIAAENIARAHNLSPMLIPTIFKDMDEQLKLALKVADLVNRANRKICVTLLWYSVDNPESSFAQVWFFAWNEEDENFQQIVFVKYKLKDFIYLLDVMLSV